MSTSTVYADAFIAPTYTPIAAARPSKGIALPIGKCLNLAGELDQPQDYKWERKLPDSDFQQIKDAGFDTIRLPVNFARYTDVNPPYLIDPAFMAKVRHIVDMAIATGINVIVDDHVEKALIANPEAHRARFLGMWQHIAAEFRDAPDSVYFELLNEAQAPMYNKDIMALFKPLIAVIRQTNPTRPIIVGGEWGNGIASLGTLEVPNDPYVVPTIHFYDPFAFTHQGAWFVTPALPTGVKFGSQSDYTKLNAELAKVKAYMARTGRVPFVGEYGAYEGIPLAERASYHGVISNAFASIGVQSCVWGYANSFPIRTNAGFIPEIIDQIATTTTLTPDNPLHSATLQLKTKKRLVSPNGRFQLTMQDDGNLVLYKDQTALWSSVTWGKPVDRMVFQTDGNLVLYSANGFPVWNSGSWGNPNSQLAIQNDGNLVIYNAAGQPVWNTETSGR